MTQTAALNNQTQPKPAADHRFAADAESQAFRDALAQQSFGKLNAALDPSASVSLPGAGVALAEASAAPPADAVTLASAELVQQDQQRGIRERGLDAASASTQELRSRAARSAESSAAPTVPTPDNTPASAHNASTPSTAHRADAQPASPPSPAQPQHASPASGPMQNPQPNANAAPAMSSSAHTIVPATPTVAPQSTSAATRSAASIQAVNSMNAAASTTKQTNTAPPFSVERATARTDRAAVAKPPRAPTQQPDPTAQIQRGLAQVLRQQGGTLTLKLTPHDLGEVKIALKMQQNRVEGTIDAQTRSARDLLRQNIDALKASLEQRGVTVDRLDVRLQGAAESDAFARSGAEPRHEHANTHADAGGDRQRGFAGGGDRHAGSRDGAPGSPERSDHRGAAAHDRDDGHGRPDEPAGGWLRLDTTA